MSDNSAARKYAKALFDQAKAANQVLACQQGLEALANVVKRQPSLKDVLNHPFISGDEKRRVVHAALGEYATPLLERFLQMLVQRHRFSLLPSIAQEFQDQVDRHNNVQPLKVRSAYQLSEPEQKDLQKHLEKWLGSKVRMEIQVDPALIGGLVIQTRDRILDQSLKGQLERLRQTLSA